MKTDSKTKSIFYKSIIIEDESGLDTIQIKKRMLLSNSAEHLRQIAGVKTTVKLPA